MTTIEREIEALKERVKQLEIRISQQEQRNSSFTISPPDKDTKRDQLRAWLEAKGEIANLPSEAQLQAETWRGMVATKQQAHVQSMRDLTLDPPLSKLITENRQ